MTAKLTKGRRNTPLMRAAALLMGLLLVTAGCLGFGGDDGEDAGTDDTNDTTVPDSGSDTTTGGNQTGSGDHEHEPEPEPHWDNRTGEVTGTNLLVESQGEAVVEEIELPETATEFAVNLTAEDGEIDGELYPPGCEESDDEPGEDCSQSIDTYESDQERAQPDGGSATWETSSPDPGTWTLRMWKADGGNNAVPYTVAFFYVDQHEPEPGHHG